MEYPVKKGQCLTVEILRLGDQGRGVAVLDGLTIFVEGAMAGETAEIEITETQPRFAVGKVTRLVKPCPGRVQPPCPVYDRCGGCCMQFMEYPTQLSQLTENIRQIFRRIGGMEEINLLPIASMEQPWHYRNKAVYRAGGTAQQPFLGFVGRGTHDVVPMCDCLLQTDAANTAARAVQGYLEENHIAPYDARTGRGLLRHVMVRTNREGRAMVVLVVNGDALPKEKQLVQALRDALPTLSGVLLNRNTRPTQEILGYQNRLLWGDTVLTDVLLGLKFSLSPLSFYQVNTTQTERLYRAAADFAALEGGETVLDAYCGAGTIGLTLAHKAEKVVGIELVPDAIRDAKENAVRNGVTNAEFLLGACEEVLPRLVSEGFLPDVVLLDPPRKGCEEKVLRAVAESAPARIVYVSCNPATLARDVKRLSALGYALEAVQPVDMFPWTGEVECVALLQ